MSQPAKFPLIAVDVGNSRIKLGRFESPSAVGLPKPTTTLALDPDFAPEQIIEWLAAAPHKFAWRVASVARSTATGLMDWLEECGANSTPIDARLLAVADLPLAIKLERPDRVGMDRLVDALAVNRLRDPKRSAIVIDLGSAITVDLVSAAGEFSGGAILPGIGMSARALHQFTDLLPLAAMTELAEPPPALGDSTVAAMRSGVYWGAVGAMRELISRLSAGLPTPQVYLTGGAAPSVAEMLCNAAGEPAIYAEHLTLSGIALAASSADHD